MEHWGVLSGNSRSEHICPYFHLVPALFHGEYLLDDQANPEQHLQALRSLKAKAVILFYFYIYISCKVFSKGLGLSYHLANSLLNTLCLSSLLLLGVLLDQGLRVLYLLLEPRDIVFIRQVGHSLHLILYVAQHPLVVVVEPLRNKIWLRI